jgi:hypothetical protein
MFIIPSLVLLIFCQMNVVLCDGVNLACQNVAICTYLLS